MHKDYIYSHIRKTGILSSIICSIILAIVIGLYFYIPFTDVFFPNSLTFANSAATMYASDVEFVEITLNDAKYTGYDCYKHGRKYASYYYSLVNNSCTLILVSNSAKNNLPNVLNEYTIKARLVEDSKLSDEVISHMAEDLNWTETGLRSVTSNITIDETSYHLDIYSYLALVLITIGLISLGFLITNIVYIILPGLHPACINFRRLISGKRGLEHVNYELSSKLILQSGSISLTENYIVSKNFFSIEIIPINSIIWAYEHSTWHNFLWFKLKLTYTLNLMCRHGIHADSTHNTKEDIDTILNYLEDNYPDIIFGYTKDNRKLAHRKAHSSSKNRRMKRR